MAAKEIYDYVSTVSPDNNETLSVDPQTVITEIATKNDVIHLMDDESEERVGLSSSFVFYIMIRYDLLNESDAGTVIDFFCDASKGNGKLSSFKFDHPDSHTYVVRFDEDITKLKDPINYSFKTIRLKILGRIADS